VYQGAPIWKEKGVCRNVLSVVAELLHQLNEIGIPDKLFERIVGAVNDNVFALVSSPRALS
jgi:hypothetical protein